MAKVKKKNPLREYRFAQEASICFSVHAKNFEEAVKKATKIVDDSGLQEGEDIDVHDDALARRIYLVGDTAPDCVSDFEVT